MCRKMMIVNGLKKSLPPFLILLFLISCTGRNPLNNFLDILKDEILQNNKDQNPIQPDTSKPANVDGCWTITQSNGEGEHGTIVIKQSGNVITGVSKWETHSNGPVSGTVTGSKLSFTITYPEGVKGYYYATVSADGASIVNGTTESSTGDITTWGAIKIACTTLSVDGCWSVNQNNGHIGTLTFKQSGSTVSGMSGWTTHSNGPISGSVNGTQLSFTITYPEGVTGFYNATINNSATALLDGYTKSSTGDYANWVAEKATCTPQTSCYKYEVDASTLALFHCNEKSGNVLLDETKLWNGNIYGDSVKRIFENCNGFLHFSNQNYALFGTIIPDGLPEGTVEFDLMFSQSDDITGTYGIFGTDGARIHFIYNNGILYFLKNHSNIHKNVYAKFTPVKEKWYHIAATWGSKGMRLFINDQLVASNSDTSCFQSSPRGSSENVFYIGKKSWFGMEGIGLSKDLSFNGNIDEIRISSTVRY